MDCGCRNRRVPITADVGRRFQPDTPASVDRPVVGRRYNNPPDCLGIDPLRRDLHSLCDRGWTDVNGIAADPLDRRAHRNSLSRLRLIGIFSFLSRLASTGSGHRGSCGGSLAAGTAMATVNLWSVCCERMANTGTRWVIFEDIFLVISCLRSNEDMRHKAEQSARQDAGERRYRSLVSAISQVVWGTDAEGRVEDIPQWRALTGQTQAQVRGLGWLDALHPDDRQRTAEIWHEAVRSGGGYDTEYRIRKADGSYGYYSVRE